MPQSLKITGWVGTKEEKGLENRAVSFFAANIVGIRNYKAKKLLSELEQSEGIKTFGKAISDAKGIFEYTATVVELKKLLEGYVDLFACVAEDGRIAGFSETSRIADIVRNGKCDRLRITLELPKEPKLIEYEKIEEKVTSYLTKNGLQLLNLDGSSEQMKMVAEEINESIDKVAELVSAEKKAKEYDLDAAGKQLLYGLGRCNIGRSPGSFALTHTEQVMDAVRKAVEEKIIPVMDDAKVKTIVETIQKKTDDAIVNKNDAAIHDPLITNLKITTDDKNLQLAFLREYRGYSGKADDFLSKHLPGTATFKRKPQVVKSLRVVKDLSRLTQNHTPLVNELFKNCKIDGAKNLVRFSREDWKKAIDTAGAPVTVKGKDDAERKAAFTDEMYNRINTAYPTEKIAYMVEKEMLPIKTPEIRKGLTEFFSKASDFDLRTKRVDDYESVIKNAVAEPLQGDLKKEMCKIQRILRVCPTPDQVPALLESNMTSAYQIAGIPKKAFMKAHADTLGEKNANKIYGKATAISRSVQMALASVWDMFAANPAFSGYGRMNKEEKIAMVKRKFPNWDTLFGTPNIGECVHSRSVLGQAAYFVDLLDYLQECKSDEGSGNSSVLDALLARRGDLKYLLLTSENVDTEIPYIDLVNEILEFHVAYPNSSSLKDAAHDTGDASAQELRAQPQYTTSTAYEKLAEALYPFNLPYHQPLDAIRTYLADYNTTRTELRNFGGFSSNSTLSINAECAEKLNLSTKEFEILTGVNYYEEPVEKIVYKYYGFSDEKAFTGGIYNVSVFLSRTGISYTDLVELLKTRLINPNRLYDNDLSLINNSRQPRRKQLLGAQIEDFYDKLVAVKNGKMKVADDMQLMRFCQIQNIDPTVLERDIEDTISIKSIIDRYIVLYQNGTPSDLTTIELKYLWIENDDIKYDNLIDQTIYLKICRMIRLQRKLGWSYADIDKVITSLGETDITATLIRKLAGFKTLMDKMPGFTLYEIVSICGKIPTGKKSLYEKLFLGKSNPEIDEVFKPDISGKYLQTGCGKVNEHFPVILAGCGLKYDDLLQIYANDKSILTEELNLEILSVIFAHSILKSFIQLSMKELCALIKLAGTAYYPFISNHSVNPEKTILFIDLAQKVKQSGFTIPQIEYIVNGSTISGNTGIVNEKDMRKAIGAIRNITAGINSKHEAKPAESLDETIVRNEMQHLFSADITEAIINIAKDKIQYIIEIKGEARRLLPQKFNNNYWKNRIDYNETTGSLQYHGVLTDDDFKDLKEQFPDRETTDQLQSVYERSGAYLRDNLVTIMDDYEAIEKAVAVLVAKGSSRRKLKNQKYADIMKVKLECLYSVTTGSLIKRLVHDAVLQELSVNLSIEKPVMNMILSDYADKIADLAMENGINGSYFKSASIIDRLDQAIDFGFDDSKKSIPNEVISCIWKGLLQPLSDGEYILTIEVGSDSESVELIINGEVLAQKITSNDPLSVQTKKQFLSEQLYPIEIRYKKQNSPGKIRLFWQSGTIEKSIIPGKNLLPITAWNEFSELFKKYHRSGLFINLFSLKYNEVEYYINTKSYIGNIDFTQINFNHWERINKYCLLKKVLPKSEITIIDILQCACQTETPENNQLLRQYIAKLFETDLPQIIDLLNHLGYSACHLTNEQVLRRCYNVHLFLKKTGIPVTSLSTWSNIQTNYDDLSGIAIDLQNAVKARYDHETWLKQAAHYNDGIRERQRQAMVSYLHTYKSLQDWGATDADSLYEYFLIDVKMQSCRTTSRIAQAIASVQLFVQRCLLNLEGPAVLPNHIATEQWEWRKNYRVWEANRKIFLWPENWLEPELRDDKSLFFKEMEAELLKNDITDRSVAAALRNYLYKLDEVAYLDVCGMHQEEQTDANFIHVVARTKATPYRYYYRKYRCDNTDYAVGTWSAWEKVDAGIQGVDNVENPGGAPYAGGVEEQVVSVLAGVYGEAGRA